MYNLNIINKFIDERIGKGTDYIGFDMSKTHSQEEENERIIKHNKNIINKFDDVMNDHIVGWFDCWKGTCFFGELNSDDLRRGAKPIKEFDGWSSRDILIWLINEGQWIMKDILSNRLALEEVVNKETNNPKEIYRIITKAERYSVLKRQKWRCNFCNKLLKFNKDSSWGEVIAHIDHIHPFSKKDSYKNGAENINKLTNLQALCPKCNLQKGGKEIN